MPIRPAYPDELGRAQSLLNGRHVPSNASYLVWVREQPIERIIAAIPSWTAKEKDENTKTLRFFLAGLDKIDSEMLSQILDRLEKLAADQSLSSLTFDATLTSGSPLADILTKRGYSISQTDHISSMPTAELKKHSLDTYKSIQSGIPGSWRLESIQGHDPKEIFNFIAPQSQITPQQFKGYWDTSNREHFKADFSNILFDDDEILGLILTSKCGSENLRIHVEAFSPNYISQKDLISASLRNAIFSKSEKMPVMISFYNTSETTNNQSGSNSTQNHFSKKLTPVA